MKDKLSTEDLHQYHYFTNNLSQISYHSCYSIFYDEEYGMETYEEIVKRLLKKSVEALSESEKRVLKYITDKEILSHNTHEEFSKELTFGEKVADKVASFGGSWPFIGIFALILILWIGGNTMMLLAFHKKPFDPYPFILLNLFLSMLAAIQAPVIMMSQNRQSAHDRIDAKHDYEVNLKAELEIMTLHQKLDELREQKWAELIELQQQQIKMLSDINTIFQRKSETEKGSANA